jgi:hypothetical protein
VTQKLVAKKGFELDSSNQNSMFGVKFAKES